MRDDHRSDLEVILYQTEDGKSRLQVRFSGETVWLTLNQFADLFQRDKSVISRHIKNIFQEGELDRDRVVADFATTAADGKTYQVEFYNLDVIIQDLDLEGLVAQVEREVGNSLLSELRQPVAEMERA